MIIEKKLTLKILGIAGASLLLVGTLSYLIPNEIFKTTPMVSGKYRLASVQDGELTYFEGPVFFEMARQHSGFERTPVLKLHFINSRNDRGSGFGFMIPLEEDMTRVGTDQFTVASYRHSFSHRFGTVFGYADIVQEFTSLYFTESGSISISASSQDEVAGEMNMLLKDEHGRSMRLKGSFNARPLFAQQLSSIANGIR